MGDVSYRPLIEDMTWSYSRLSSFEQCPYKWFMSYIRDEEEAPAFYASYGSFVHRLIRRFYDGELTAKELPDAFLLGFSTEVLGKRPAQSTVVKYIRAGLDYFENFTPFPYETVAVEKELHFDLNGVPFVGFVDYLGKKDGKYVVLDHKSRELKPRSGRKKPTLKDQELDGMLRQLYIYSHGIEQVYGELPGFLCFNCFRNGELIEEPFREDAYLATLDWASEKIEEISDETDFRPWVDYFACKNLCGFFRECCYAQGGM